MIDSRFRLPPRLEGTPADVYRQVLHECALVDLELGSFAPSSTHRVPQLSLEPIRHVRLERRGAKTFSIQG